MSSIETLLEKTSHWDKDERYMATNDLCTELSKDTKMDENIERRICAAVLKQLDDKSNDVRSVAVKCLAMLLRKVQPAQIGDICDKLCTLIIEGSGDLRDIYSIGLKTLISDVAESTGALVASKATGRLLAGINNSSATAAGDDVKKECLDSLSELLRRFGHHLTARDHEVVMETAVRALGATKPVVRKRAAVCLGALSMVSGDELLNRLMTQLLDRMDAPGCSTEDTRTWIASICIVSRDVGGRLGGHLPRILPLFLRCCGAADDEDTQSDAHNEVRENCFPGLESFVLCCPREVAPYLSAVLDAAVVFMAYDPNFCGDDAEMDVDDEYEEEYEEDEWDQGGQDEGEDDSSWKVRKAAVRLVASVLAARPELLGEVQARCQGPLARRFQERVENVRLDVVACFTRLLQCVVAGGSSASGAAAVAAQAGDIVAAVVRQLREGTGAGLTASALAGVVKTKCALFAMLRVLATALRGQAPGLEAHLPTLMPLAVAAVREGSPAERLEALGFVRSVLDSAPAAAAQQYAAELVPVLAAIVGVPAAGAILEKDSKHLVVEGLGALQRLVEVCHSTGADASALAPLHAAVLARFESNEVDAEVKVSTMACVGFLVSRFGTGAGFELPRVLSVLGRRLESEPTRASSLKALTVIAQSPQHLDLSLCHSPAGGGGSIVDAAVGCVSASSRLLKHSGTQLLNALLLNSAAAASHAPFPAPTVCVIVEAVAACMGEQDMYVCAQALQTVDCVVAVSQRLSAGDAAAVNALLLEKVYRRLLDLTVSPLLQDATLEHLVRSLRALVTVKCVACAQVFQDLCAKVVPGLAKQSVASISKCTVGVITTSPETTEIAVAHFTAKLSTRGGDGGADSLRLFALLCIGSLHAHLGSSAASSATVSGLVMACLTDSAGGSEDLKHTAAVTLGQLAASSADAFLPLIVSGVAGSNAGAGAIMNPMLYLYLVALKECIEASVGAGAAAGALVSVALPLLFTVTASAEESIRSIAAECLGLLMYVDMGAGGSASTHILQQLCRALETGPDAAAGPNTDKLLRWTVITALKCCFSRPVTSVPGAAIDTAGVMELYLGLMESLAAALGSANSVVAKVPEPSLLSQLDCELCKSAVLFINASVHYNAAVMKPYMREGRVMSFLLQALGFQQERVVDLGPFKHKVDDGLPVRKSALICFETVLDVAGELLDCQAVLQRLLYASTTLSAEGKEKNFVLLVNDKDEVKFNGYQVLAKLCQRAPGAVLGSLERVVEVLSHLFKKAHDLTMSTSAGPGAAGAAASSADSDRLYELVRLACQVIAAINSREAEAAAGGSSHAQALASWKSEFLEKVVMKRPLLVNTLQAIQNEKTFE